MPTKTAIRSTDMETVSELVGSILTEEAKSGTTIYNSRTVLRILRTKAGICSTADLDDDAIRRFQRAIARKKVRERNSLLTSCRALCNRLVRLRLLESCPYFPPTTHPSKFKSAVPAVPLSVADVNRYLAHLAGRISGTPHEAWQALRLYTLVSLIVSTGVFRGEVFAIRVDDVDLDSRTIGIRRRQNLIDSAFPRVVPISEKLLPVLTEWMARVGCDWLFPGNRRKVPWNGAGTADRSTPYWHLRETAREAGLPHLTFKMLQQFYRKHVEPAVNCIDLPCLRDKAPDRPAIELTGPGKAVLLPGVSMPPIGDVEYDAISVMLAAGRDGLSKDQMAHRCEYGAWRNYLADLVKSHDYWKAVILMAGKPYGRYKIAWISSRVTHVAQLLPPSDKASTDG
jgi:integrase